MSALPDSWAECLIGDVTQIVAGGTPPSKEASNFTTGHPCIPWITPADLSGYKQIYISHGARSLTEKGFSKSSAKKMPAGSVLFSSRAPIGYVAIAANEISTNQGFKSFVLPDGINNHFIYYYLKYIKPVAEEMATGTTFKELSGSAAAKIPLIVAPSNEQKRIADKLDVVLARVDACRDRLDRIPAILKRFRQAVLAAATSGKLTEDWRCNSGLLNSSETQILSDVADVIDPHPSHRTPPVVANGVPYIGIGEVDKSGNLNITNAKKVSWDVFEDHKKRYQVRDGDFMFGKIGTLGRPTLLPSGEKYVVSANVILIQPNPEKVIPRYLLLLFSSPQVLADVAGQANSTSQAAFGIKKMRAFPLLLPSKQEQTEIVRRVEALFACADRLEARYAAARAQVEKLTPATLAKAFRGELVPQDPNDEPASMLLERIHAQRNKPQASKPSRCRREQG